MNRGKFLGIEVGGTKLQLGIGDGASTEFSELIKMEVGAERTAVAILQQIVEPAIDLVKRHAPQAVGIGFGGPVFGGRTVTSHHVEGWADFPLADWCGKTLKLEACVVNDCDAAALAESHLGAGRGEPAVLYVTVGTGIGGGFVVNGELFGTHGRASCEIGHLRPGLASLDSGQIIEAESAGWGIEAAAKRRVDAPDCDAARSLRDAASGKRITARLVGEQAAAGNPVAQEVLVNAIQHLGWAVAQAITLLAPTKVILGGGVSQLDPQQFLIPLRLAIQQYGFPALADSYRVELAELGESVVVHGALLAAQRLRNDRSKSTGGG